MPVPETTEVREAVVKERRRIAKLARRWADEQEAEGEDAWSAPEALRELADEIDIPEEPHG